MAVLPEVGLFRSEDLADVLSVIDDMHVPYAGATALVPAMRLGVRRPEVLVDLKRVDALRGVSVDPQARTVRIGAATPHQALAGSPEVREHVPSLASAASRVGNARVRASGTLGGNLCFAEPRSDLSVVLTALGAHAEIATALEVASIPVAELILGAYETCLTPDQLMLGVTVPFEPDGFSYWKLQSYERPTLGIATVPVDGGMMIVVGAATERPERATIATGDLVGLEDFLDGLELSDDLSGSPAYKRAILRSRLRAPVAGNQ